MAKNKPKGMLRNSNSILPSGADPIIGVYAIHFAHSSKVYIGSSKNIRTRLRNHYLKLQSGKHPNYKLQYQNKFGEPMFVILNQYDSALQAREREQKILNETPESRLYNIDKKVWGYNDRR